MTKKQKLVTDKLKINYATKTQIDSADNLSETELYIIDPEYNGHKAIVTDDNGDFIESITTDTEVAKLSGIKANVQTQLDTLDENIKNIQSKIPEEASSDNQLADKGFVEEKIDEALERATVFKGIIDNQTLLPASGNKNGDMYWIRTFVEPAPEGMKVGHSGSAVYNGQTQSWEFEADEVFDPDNKSIILNSDGQLSVQLSAEANNNLEIKNDGLYVSSTEIDAKIDAEIERAMAAEQSLDERKQDKLSEGTGIDITNNTVSLDAVLNDLNDVEITSAENENFLLFNSELSKWINFKLTEIDGGHAGEIPPTPDNPDGGDSSIEPTESIDNGDSGTSSFDETLNGGDSTGN